MKKKKSASYFSFYLINLEVFIICLQEQLYRELRKLWCIMTEEFIVFEVWKILFFRFWFLLLIRPKEILILFWTEENIQES